MTMFSKRTHTISNASTFSGWLESVGLDDVIANPCACIFGEPPPEPTMPGQRRVNQKGSQRGGVNGGPGAGATGPANGGARSKRGNLSRQATLEVEEPKSPFSSFSFFGGNQRSTGVPNGGAAGPPTEEKKSSNPALAFFNNRSISLVDMYTDMGEPTEKCGELNFGLEYDFATQTLKLKIIQARDLAAKDTNGLSDPYVRVTLLPDKKHRLETKIKRRTLNPRWNETFYFEGFPINKLQARVLHLHCYDYDRFSRDDSIGEIHLPLCQVDFTSKPQYWKPLYPPIKEKLGELLVSLTYHPSKNTLSIVILKAKNLKAKDINGKSDPYVKVWLMFGDKRVEKKKTPVYKCNLNPIFNATFEFDVPWEQIRDCALDVQVMDFDTVGRNELIGKLCLGSKNGSGPSETKQWQDMIAKPRQAVVVWHRLKPGD